jgi:methionyl aminopeptidase
MHEAPQVLHWGKRGTGLVLREGMTFTIEPMLNQGRSEVFTQKDGWTVVTRDGQLSAQFEHTVAVTKHGVKVLTLRAEEASDRPAALARPTTYRWQRRTQRAGKADRKTEKQSPVSH